MCLLDFNSNGEIDAFDLLILDELVEENDDNEDNLNKEDL